MAATPVETTLSNGVSVIVVAQIGSGTATQFKNFPSISFGGTDHPLISQQGYENIRSHIVNSLRVIPFMSVDVALLNKPFMYGVPTTEVNTVIGCIDMEKLPASSFATHMPSVLAVLSGSNVVVSGLCHVYFNAMRARLAGVGLSSATRAAAPVVQAITDKFRPSNNPASRFAFIGNSSQRQPVTSDLAFMKDDLVESKLSEKVIALAVRHALLQYYSDEQLMAAMIELHNNKAPFTVFLRKNSNWVSDIFGKDTHSWTEAVTQIKAVAQYRLRKLSKQIYPSMNATTSTFPADEARKITLLGIADYKSDLFNDTLALTN